MSSNTEKHSDAKSKHSNSMRNHHLDGHSHKPTDKPYYKMVVIAASLGGIHALGEILSVFPEDFPVPIAIIQHRTAHLPWQLDKVLGRKTKLKVKYAVRGEPILPGTVYIAPHDHHLLVETSHRFALTNHTRIRHVRPSANPLFISAAKIFKERVIAVVLTGGDADATDGVQSVSTAGGIVLAQDQATSEHFSMPKSAIETGCVDRVLPLHQIGDYIVKLVQTRKNSSHTNRAGNHT